MSHPLFGIDSAEEKEYIKHIVREERRMLYIDWAPITEKEEPPNFGEELAAHLDSYKGEVRQESCSAWNLLYRTLTRMGHGPYHVSFTETGKPYFRDSEICFSISHSKEVCAVAVSDRPVGLDVQVIKDSYRPHLIDRTLTDREKETFDGDFTRMWCRKEAVVKMTGDGIKHYPFRIETTEYSFWERKIEYNGSRYWIVSLQG